MYVAGSGGSAYSPQAQSMALTGSLSGSTGGGGSSGWSGSMGGMMQFGGAYMEGIGRHWGLKAEQKAQAFNKETAKLLAAEAERNAAWNISRSLVAGRKLLSQSQFAFGFAGVTMEGTPTDVLEEMDQEMQLDREMVWREGQMAKKMHLAEADWYAKAEKAAKKGGILNAFSTTINAWSSMVGK